jgi:16S rRNA (cytosine1402-N4)-methyltransferase
MTVAPLEFETDPPATSSTPPHTSVLRDEVIRFVEPRTGGTYVDATLGAGGHTEALLDAAPGARVLGLDRDEAALERARPRLARFGEAVRLLSSPFSNIADVLTRQRWLPVDGIIADLGVSSPQLTDPARGMSFRFEGPLDMRMDPSGGETALDLISRLSDEELADLIYQYGQERRSRRIARCIRRALHAGELRTTIDLRRAVVRAVGPARVGGIDPATRTFQALRIAVNDELGELSALLASAPSVLAAGGVLAVISFHSLEDRLVKHAFADRLVWQKVTPKPVTPSREEVETNPRSRSAKLRVARKAEGGQS